MSQASTEFLQIFRDEATDRLDRIVEALLALEREQGAADAVDALFRDVHTIKGAAGMVGLDEIGSLAHVMEDLLATARDEGSLSPNLIAPLLHAADVLRQHVDGAGPAVAGVIAELAAAQAAPAVPAPMPAPDAPDPAAFAPAPATPDPATHAPTGESRSIRVPAEKIDTLLDLVGETVLHRRRLEHELELEAGRGSRSVADELDAGARLLDELTSASIGMRTLPLSTIVAPLPRAVRDLARETGKDVELIVDGAETELDRVVLERLPEQLVHLLRNAIAHGIEDPPERRRQGKPERGRLILRAQQRGGMVEIVVADDGRGVSEETLARARARGSLTAVLTQPGFSTASGVTGISGRGVGLDAVKDQVEDIGGGLDVRSTPGHGMEVVLRLPLSLALIEVLLVERAGTAYGFPLSSVEEAVSVVETMSIAGRPAIELRGGSIPLFDLVALLGDAPGSVADRPLVVVLSAAGKRIAVTCDTLLGKEEVVVKPLGSLLTALPTYLGAAILGDGRIALLVDPLVLVDRSTGQPGLAASSSFTPAAGGPPSILVVEDSLTIRELQRSILEAAGYRVQTARNGRDALERLDGDAEFDLVVSDVEMPEVDGLELTRAIRAHATRSALPVVIVTSLGDEDDRQRGIEAGADAYMVKQAFDQSDLLATVERLVGR